MDYRRWFVAGNWLATWPWRCWANRQAMRQGHAPVMVLFYHRVADTVPNDWTISCQLFERQMLWLKRHVDVVSLAEAQRRLASGRNDRLTACVTFDDGYADNCDFAIPWLLSEGVPCTYFVASRHVLDQQPFPHDVARGFPLAPNTPDQIVAMSQAGIEIGAHTRHHVDVATIANLGQLTDEISGSGDDLADLTRRPVRYFAFPYGQPENLSPRAFQVARDSGYQAVCSAYGGYNWPGQDSFQFRRIHGDPDMWRFRNWLTVDRRKDSMHAPYDDSLEPATAAAWQRV